MWNAPATPALIALFGALAAVPAQVAFHDPAGRVLIASDAEVETLAAGLRFADGPVWLAAAQKLVFSDSAAGKLLQWTADAGVSEVVDCEASSGNALDAQGRLVTCQFGTQSLVRRDADHTLTVLVRRYEGKRLHSLNDLAVRMDGSVWFTDPDSGLARRRAWEDPWQDRREGSGSFVYRFDPETRALWVVQRDFDQPDGICFAPDHNRVYISDAGRRRRIGAFPVEADGTLGTVLFWIECAANGMRCDAQGNLYAAAPDGIRIFSPSGLHLVTVPVPVPPSNCAFGGMGLTQLYVTAGSLLCRVEVLVPGAPMLPPQRAAAPARSRPGK